MHEDSICPSAEPDLEERMGTSSPGPISPGSDHTWLSAGSQEPTAVTSLAPKGHRTSPPASSPALRMPPGAAEIESPFSPGG